MCHKTRQITDLAFDNDVAAFHCDTTARAGVSFDVNQSAEHRGPEADTGIAVYRYVATGHCLSGSPAGVARYRDAGAVVETATVVANTALEMNLCTSGQADPEIMAGTGIGHDDRQPLLNSGPNVLVALAQGAVGNLNFVLVHAARSSDEWVCQVCVRLGPSKLTTSTSSR